MSFLRKSGFFLVDGMQGAPVAKHMHRLARAHKDPDFAASYRQEALQNLLDHATNYVPHYQQFSGTTSLSELPTLSKATVQEHYSDFLSTQYNPGRLITKSTSGSYGTPLVYRSCKEQNEILKAELIFYSRWAGYEVGVRHLFINHVKHEAGLPLFLQNQLLLNPIRMDAAWLRNCASTILRKDVLFLIAQPSVLDTIRIYCLENGVKLMSTLKGIIMVSEPCSPHLRQQLEEFYGCPVQGRYAAVEQGLIAQQCRSDYHVNPLNHIVEILNIDNDDPAPAGTIGRVVITNLSARAMPLIRYETGDLAAAGESCDCEQKGMVLTEIIGRQVEVIIDTSGNKILPIAFWSVLRGHEAIRQYQFIQHGQRDYEIRIRTTPGFTSFFTCQQALRSLLGQDANIEVRLVDEISPLPSGKRPLVINLYRKQGQEQ